MATTKVSTKQQLVVTANLDFANYKGTNLLDPTNPQDAATKAYVDANSAGLDVKLSARAATTGVESYTISSGAVTQITGLVIDGVTLTTGNRLLIKNAPATTGTGNTTNTNNAPNGIYEVTGTAGSNLQVARAADANANAEVHAGMFLFVTEGTDNGDAGFVLVTNDPITLNTTTLQFTQFSGAGQITAGNGLTKTGNTLNVGGTADRITVNADTVDIASTYVGQTSIVTLGTVSTGTWSANTIAVDRGGTGRTSHTAYMPLVGGTTSTGAQQSVSAGSTSGQALLYQGASAVPVFGAINLAGGTNIVSGTLPIASGGTGLTGTPTNGQLLIGNGTGYTQAALTAGTGIAITNGAGSITVAVTGVLTSSSFVVREIPSGTINGTNPTFTLAATPTAGTETIYVNGVLQNVGSGNDYTISGATITFQTGAIPQTGDVILACYLK